MPASQADGPERVTRPAHAALAARDLFIETLRGQIAPLQRIQFGTPKLAVRRFETAARALWRATPFSTLGVG